MVHPLTASPATPTPDGNVARDKQLEQAAEAFEAVFLNLLFKTMRQAMPSGGLFASEQMQAYQELQDRELAQSLARRRSIGIAEILIRQLQSPAATTGPTGSPGEGDPAVATAVGRTSATAESAVLKKSAILPSKRPSGEVEGADFLLPSRRPVRNPYAR